MGPFLDRLRAREGGLLERVRAGPVMAHGIDHATERGGQEQPKARRKGQTEATGTAEGCQD